MKKMPQIGEALNKARNGMGKTTILVVDDEDYVRKLLLCMMPSTLVPMTM